MLIGIHTSKECFPGTSPFVITTYFPIEGPGIDGLSWNHQEFKGSEPGDTPNFYYYWRNTAADCAPGKHDYTAGCSESTSTIEMGYYNRGDSIFHFCKGAAGYNDFTKHIGIDTFAEVCLHEKNHMDNWNLWWPGGYNKDNDSDEDYVPDDVERDDPSLDENNKCSCDPGICESLRKISEKYAIDYECLAFKTEKDWTPCSADSEDFSDLSSRIYPKNYCLPK
jgi:hypothetical protein